MVGSDTVNFCVRAAMGWLLVAGSMNVWVLIALQAVGGVATAFYSPASTGLVPQTVPARLLQQANGFMSIARYVAFPLGAAVGGVVVATIGAGEALLLDAATYATSALLLVRLRLPERARRAAAPNFIRELREGWHAFTEHTWVWVLTIWISLYFLVTYAPVFVLGPYIAKQSLGGAGAWATIVTGEGIGALVGGILALRFRPRRPWVFVCGIFACSGIQSALLALHSPAAAIAAAAVLAGFGFSFGTVLFETGVQERIAPEKLSRVSAYNWLGAMAFLPMGYALAGPIADAIGMSTYLWFGAGWIVVTTLALMLVRDVREYRPLDVTEAAVVPAT
jgi:predicted MFS family arabinose efflux permease